MSLPKLIDKLSELMKQNKIITVLQICANNILHKFFITYDKKVSVKGREGRKRERTVLLCEDLFLQRVLQAELSKLGHFEISIY